MVSFSGEVIYRESEAWMTIKKIIDMATAKIYEQSTGISQQEIERVIRKVVLLTVQEAVKGTDQENYVKKTIESLEELKDV
jgi:hypothetical protein